MNRDVASVIFGTLIMLFFVMTVFRSFNKNQIDTINAKQEQRDSVMVDIEFRQKLLQLSDSLQNRKINSLRRDIEVIKKKKKEASEQR